MADQITVTNADATTELFNVYYGAENRQKRIEWVTGGTGSGTTTVNLLYSALQNLFDELAQMDDGVPMSAQTPTEYTIGIIDSGDKDPWFIDRTSVEHLTGGALKTASWDRVQDSNVGIIKIEYTIGTIESNTHIYIYQNSSNLVAYKAATDWWGDGHVDILVNVKELGTETDEGYISVFARQYSKTYSYYSVDLTNGGRNPIPLQTGNDLDNQTGFWQMDLSTSSGTFVDGEVIQDDSDSTIKGVVTSWEGTNKIIEYYLIGDPITNFGAGTGAFTGATSLATGTAVAPTAVGP